MSSYEHRPVNVNRGGVSRSGFTSDSRMADAPRSDWRAPDMHPLGYVALVLFVIGLWMVAL